MASSLGVKKIKEMKNEILFSFEDNFSLNYDEIKALIKEYPIQFNSTNSGETELTLVKGEKGDDTLITLKAFLEEINRLKNP